jgi:hypothetical protein
MRAKTKPFVTGALGWVKTEAAGTGELRGVS